MADSAMDQMRTEADNFQEPIPPTENGNAPQTSVAPQAPMAPSMVEETAPMDTLTTPLPPYLPPQPQAQAPPPVQQPPQQQPRTATPNRAVNGTAEAAMPMPAKAASHGAPTRRYLNEKVTGALLEGMKRLAADQPEKPLQVLGEFLLQKSAEQENKPVA